MRRQVWVLEHVESDYDSHSSEIRGVFSTEEHAKAARDLHGVRFREYGGTDFQRHGEHCCFIGEHWVEDGPELPYHGPPCPWYYNQPPGHRDGGGIIPQAFIEQITQPHGRSIFASGTVHTYRPDDLTEA